MGDDDSAQFEEGMSANQLLENAAKRMMGVQEDADGTSEIEADYAWLRDDEIYLECVEMFPFLAKQNDAKDVLETLLTDERWPVRVMANLVNFMLSVSEDPKHFSEYENRRLLGNWIDAYRAMDPDPTEP